MIHNVVMNCTLANNVLVLTDYATTITLRRCKINLAKIWFIRGCSGNVGVQLCINDTAIIPSNAVVKGTSDPVIRGDDNTDICPINMEITEDAIVKIKYLNNSGAMRLIKVVLEIEETDQRIESIPREYSDPFANAKPLGVNDDMQPTAPVDSYVL